jgi:hypothetical protein
LRRTSGQSLKRDIQESHTGEGWLAYWNDLVSTTKSDSVGFPIAVESTYDDILLSLINVSGNNWGKVSNETCFAVRKFGASTKSHLLVDWLLQRNLFCTTRIPSKYFLSQQAVTGIKRLLHVS